MKIPYYRIHSFTSDQYTGNPAGVCLLDQWLDDDLMQNIAFENNLSETAFIVKEAEMFHIRWFTPTVEVDLCGHATLAAGYVIFEHTDFNKDIIEFKSKSGILRVGRRDDIFSLNFPADNIKKVNLPEIIERSFHEKPIDTYRGNTDFLLIFENEKIVKNCIPNFDILKKADGRGVIISSRGAEADFVSRFFGPQSGIDEDPVTGSAHTTLVPYWSSILGKNEFVAHQVSSRGGELLCRNLGDRVEISGRVHLYMAGSIFI